MKVLWVGHYKDGYSGWASACQNYIRALDSVGVQVVPRAIKLNNSPPQVHERVAELERQSASGCDIVVQNVLPHWMERVGGIPNVGLSYFESKTLKLANWPNRLRLMDSMITSNVEGCDLLEQLEMPSVSQIPIPEDFSDFDNVEPYDIPQLRGKFVFYFIGEFTKRKNIAGIIRAFNTAFTPRDNVALVLKLSKFGKTPIELKNEASKFIDDIKRGMKLPMYNRELLITDNLSREQIIKLHKTGNCLVSASYGEGSCIPVWHALACGNKVVAPYYAGIDHYNDISFFCSGIDNCFGDSDNFPFLFTGLDEWAIPNISDMAYAMRQVIDNKQKTNSDFFREEFSFSRVGKALKECLEKQLLLK